jgi:hypothetical protein
VIDADVDLIARIEQSPGVRCGHGNWLLALRTAFQRLLSATSVGQSGIGRLVIGGLLLVAPHVMGVS